LRTSAMTAMVVPRLFAGHARKLALFGAGLQGRSQAEALAEQMPFEEIAIVDPVPQAEWCARLAERTGARVAPTTAELAVRDADVVITATRSSRPVFDGEWLRPGALVAAIGTSSPKGRELDDLTMQRAARVVVEWKPQSLHEAGEIVLWHGRHDVDRFVDLPQLFSDERPWHVADDHITVFKSVGVGLSDVAAAWLAHRRTGAGR
jgi:ornithine cyclodeaminase